MIQEFSSVAHFSYSAFPQADAPNATLIPDENLLDVTVVLLLGLYKDQEFIRVGYYVNNEIRTSHYRVSPMMSSVL